MNRRETVLAIAALGAALAPAVAWAQKRVARVGFLGTGALSASPHILAGFKDGMRSLGWTEGSNIEYLVLAADGYVERLDALAQQMVRENVDVIVAGPPPCRWSNRPSSRCSSIAKRPRRLAWRSRNRCSPARTR